MACFTPPLFVLSLSGGLDSTVLCADLLATHGPKAVQPVFFIYGSKHNAQELTAAQKVADYYELALKTIDLSKTFLHVTSGLLASDERDIPQDAYNQDSMQLTVVPGRNLIFASVLAAVAESNNIPTIALATHGGDHHLYPDCRPAFNEALALVVAKSTDNNVRVITPFEQIGKDAIVSLGLRHNAPFHLTRSCYAQTTKSCGTCGTCRERLDAFAAHGVVDPIEYE